MRLILVRHGHPNYELDCLTELGHVQAEAVAERLQKENIAQIFTSASGRAVETAEHIAKKHDLPVTQFDFMRELQWGSMDGTPIPFEGHPWQIVNAMLAAGEDLMDPDWEKSVRFQNNTLVPHVHRVMDGFDPWLAELGYVREGNCYRVREENPDNVILVSHGGASSVVLSRLFNLPFPYVCKAIQPTLTAVSIIHFKGEAGSLIVPMMELLNDGKHTEGINVQNYYGK